MCLTGGLASWFHGLNLNLLLLGRFIIVVTIIQWWRDVVRERTIQGFHSLIVSRGLRIGMVLFITSEVCFFFAFFWAFFHRRLSPTIELGNS